MKKQRKSVWKDVFNHSSLRMEKGMEMQCPKCRGFGGEKGVECSVCKGDGRVIRCSLSGWTRRVNSPKMKSLLW